MCQCNKNFTSGWFKMVRMWISGWGSLVLVGAKTLGTIVLCSDFSGGWSLISEGGVIDCLPLSPGTVGPPPKLLCCSLGVDSCLSLEWLFGLLHTPLLFLHCCDFFSVCYSYCFQEKFKKRNAAIFPKWGHLAKYLY